MRLIHTKSLQFKEYAPDAVPGGYAILSHRWVAGQEISFQEMLQPNRDTVSKTGYTKIKGFCERAAFNNFQYAWIDTCCINKESSAELSDAINSMFQWYQNAAKCYVYLNDVENISQFSRSEWFQRGWTLQELLAPDEVQFFSKKWMPLGRKKDQNIIEILSTITKIPEQDLKYDIQVLLLRNSLARRMSWASQRKTTRAEDMAYCLLGLFGVNMDLRYGEGGANAFLRLQEHIIKISDDTSIFAWSIPSSHARADFGLLAPSVDCFVNSHEIGFMDSRPELFGMTQKGLRITLSLRCMIDPYYFADINFVPRRIEDRNPTGPLAIYLVREPNHGNPGIPQFCRIGIHSLPVELKKKLLAGKKLEEFPLEHLNLFVRQRAQSSDPLPAVSGNTSAQGDLSPREFTTDGQFNSWGQGYGG